MARFVDTVDGSLLMVDSQGGLFRPVRVTPRGEFVSADTGKPCTAGWLQREARAALGLGPNDSLRAALAKYVTARD